MTEKKEKILHSALEMFSEEGFRTTSTRKIAKKAGVSEGLIFRHFKNKEGLLRAIIKEGEERAKTLFADIVMEADARAVIRKTIEIGIKTKRKKEELDFWKLQYKIKWELEKFNEQKTEPLETALKNAFEKLDYEQPLLEAKLLLMCLDGLATRLFLQPTFDIEESAHFLFKKYKC